MDDNNERPSYEPELAQPPTPAPGAKYSSMQRLWMMFTSPAEVFADIGIKPTWVVAMVILVIVGVGAQLVIMPHVDTEATIRESFEKRGTDLSEAQLDKAVEQATKIAKFAPIISLVIAPIMWAIMAAVFFLMLKIVGSDADYSRSLSSTLYGYWPPTLVALVLTSVLVQRLGKVPQEELANVVKANLGAFMSADAPAWLLAIGNTISIFNIWAIVLLIIGFSTVGKISKGKAAVVTLVPWITWIVVKAAIAAVMA
jgi:hypothetical protein